MKRQPPISLRRSSRGGSIFRAAAALVAVVLLLPAVPHFLALGYPRPSAHPADAVMVLAGGEGRIPEGYRAWVSGAARELYILGAVQAVPLGRLYPQATRLPPESLSRVHVEGWSENTLENAFSAKAAVEGMGYSSVVLVTSDYHVPRAWIAFRKILPARVALSVLPVRSEGWGSPGAAWRTLRRHFLEGWKYWGYRILLRWE